jgi:hypothetical protein
MRARVRLVVALLVVGFGVAPATAQTTTARLVWNMPNTVADSQSFTYALKDGTAAAVTLASVTCATVATVTQCQAPIAPPASGPHSFVLTASSPVGSASSSPLVGTTPGAPFTLTINITVTVP